MIRSHPSAPKAKTPPAVETGGRADDEMRVLREVVTALSERVEILEAQALLTRPLLAALGKR